MKLYMLHTWVASSKAARGAPPSGPRPLHAAAAAAAEAAAASASAGSASTERTCRQHRNGRVGQIYYRREALRRLLFGALKMPTTRLWLVPDPP